MRHLSREICEKPRMVTTNSVGKKQIPWERKAKKIDKMLLL